MDPLAVESWILYAVIWVVVVARTLSQRLLRGSFKKFQLDDLLMAFAIITDTVLVVSMNIVAHSSSNLIDPDDHTELTPENVKEREFGSKMVLVVEEMQLITTWTVKFCLLILYHRITINMKENLAVKIVAGYVAIGFVTMEILYLGVWCRPFYKYWAVPTDNIQCSAATNHLITNAVINISSDLMIIMLPMPMLIRSQMPLKRKAILCGVFALGAFTILSAMLNKYYSFTQPFGVDWTFWYIRESSTALIVANLPLTWPLIRRVFKLRSFGHDSSDPRYGGTTLHFRSTTHSAARRGTDVVHHEQLGSQEHINTSYSVPLKIFRQQEFQVHSHPVSGDDRCIPMGYEVDALHVSTSENATSRGEAREEETASERSAAGIIKESDRV